MKSPDKHQFAFYHPYIGLINIKQDFHMLEDKDLVNRIVTIIRLDKGDIFILFDQQHNILVELIEVHKKKLYLAIRAYNKNNILKPTITYGLPLLKKEAFENALYTLAELGIQTIQPLITEKTTRIWLTEDLSRLEKIIIAACEQAKQFTIPHLEKIINLTDWLNNLDSKKNNSIITNKIFFDVSGESGFSILSQLRSSSYNALILLSGPEGDLTLSEKKIIKDHNFISCALTSTILRAQQAIALGAGIVRSML